MGRKNQITKEKMLEAAYEILEKRGYAFVNIKTIAEKSNCSTQPISWQFGNMQGLRRELYLYAKEKLTANTIDNIKGMNAVDAFFETGKAYISNACDHPNVFRFLYVDSFGDFMEKQDNILDMLGDDFIKKMISNELNIPIDVVERITADIVIYTHGLAVLLLSDGVSIEKKQVYQMVFDHAKMCFDSIGIDVQVRDNER